MGFAFDTKAVSAAGWAEDIGQRESMEDGTIFIDCFGGRNNAAYFAVFDGHGGRAVVDMVTTELHILLLRELRRTTQVPDALRSTFSNCDKELRRRNITMGGATACVCVLQQERLIRKIYTAHLGDSRAVMSRGGTATRLTSRSDHRATDPLERKRVLEAGGHIVNDRVNGMLAMTRALGDNLLKMPTLANDVISNVPDITCTDLMKEDAFVVVACDGIWDVMSDQEVIDIFHEGMEALRGLEGRIKQEGKNLAEILSRYIIEEALARNATDNISCMVIFL
eukprot:GEMP01068871.1.p1 GENE.GEMP01068871.1~~GEMP01068871.1.p1  ORF type:complete len:281 (+),score=58.26 GEMP01068871.1:104-946(+)